MEDSPSLVDGEVTGTTLPTAQDDHPGRGPGLVNRAVDMANDDEIGPITAGRRVIPIDLEVPFLVVEESALFFQARTWSRPRAIGPGSQPKDRKNARLSMGGLPQPPGRGDGRGPAGPEGRERSCHEARR